MKDDRKMVTTEKVKSGVFDNTFDKIALYRSAFLLSLFKLSEFYKNNLISKISWQAFRRC